MTTNQINGEAILRKMIHAAPMLGSCNLITEAASGFVDSASNSVVAAAMSSVFEDINISPRSAKTVSKAKLKARLVREMEKVLAPKPEPKASGFDLDAFLADAQAASPAASPEPLRSAPEVSSKASQIAELEARLAAMRKTKPKPEPKPKLTAQLSPHQTRIAELEYELAALAGRAGTVDPAPVKAKCNQAKRFRGALSASVRINGEGYDVSAKGVRRWENRELVPATLTATESKAAKAALAELRVELKALEGLL